jgi:Tfp pilus assembly protein PilF
VDAIVEGSLVRAGNRVRITAQLIDARDDRHLWAQSFEGQIGDLLSLQDRVAREIAAQTRVALTPVAHVQHVDPAAHDAYLRGLYFLLKREPGKSADYFQQAISIDPSYAAAFAGLANALEAESVFGMIRPTEAMPRAFAAAKHAIELDPNSGEAFTALGGAEATMTWDWQSAERDLQRGIALSPSDSLAEIKYSIYLDAVNRPEEAVAHMRRAVELDPLSFFMNRHLGSSLYLARHYDEALYHLRRGREMEPGKANIVDNWISWIYEKKGDAG